MPLRCSVSRCIIRCQSPLGSQIAYSGAPHEKDRPSPLVLALCLLAGQRAATQAITAVHPLTPRLQRERITRAEPITAAVTFTKTVDGKTGRHESGERSHSGAPLRGRPGDWGHVVFRVQENAG